jgi:hypothetical protein
MALTTVERICHIVSGSVEEESGAGDGAYDLFNKVGTPDEIGKVIAESLKECDLYSGRCPSAIDAGHELYLTVRIKVCKGVICEFNEQGGAVLTLKQELDNARFSLGSITLTPGVITALEESGQHVSSFIARHVQGDWGNFGQCDRIELTEEEKQLGWSVTDDSGKINKSNLLRSTDSVISEFSTYRGKTIWVFTRLDNGGGTTVLLPDEN